MGVTHVPVWLGNGDTACAEWDGLGGGSSRCSTGVGDVGLGDS